MTTLMNEARTRAKNLQPRDPGSAELLRRMALVIENQATAAGTMRRGLAGALKLLREFAEREDIAADTISEIHEVLEEFPEIDADGNERRKGDWFWLTDDKGNPFDRSYTSLEDLFDTEDPLEDIVAFGHGIELPTLYALRLPYEDETVIETFHSLPKAEAARERFYADQKLAREPVTRDEKEALK